MTTLSRLQLSTPDPGDKARLAAWLQEWAVAAQLDHDSDAADESGDRLPEATFDTIIRPAEIRLLSPRLTPLTRSRPVHVLVLEVQATGHGLVAPFSRFVTPALPGELTVETGIPALRVVCAWNRCRVSAAVLRASWTVSTLPSTSVTDCRELGMVPHGISAPAPWRERVGPPLTHPLDPRHRYIDAETALRRSLELLSDSAPMAYPPPPDDAALDKAAEPPPDYDA